MEDKETDFDYLREVFGAVTVRNSHGHGNKGDFARVTVTLDRVLFQELEKEKARRSSALESASVSAIIRDALAVYFRLTKELNIHRDFHRGPNSWARGTGIDSDKDVSWKR